MFNIPKNCETVFQSGCTVLYSHQQRRRVPVPPRPHPHLLVSVFPILAVLVPVKWCLAGILICLPLVTAADRHLPLCLFAEMSIQILGSFLNQAFHLFIVEV